MRSTVFVPELEDTESQCSSASDRLNQVEHYRATSTSTDGEESDSNTSDATYHNSSRRLPPLRSPAPDLTEQAICYSLQQLEVNSRVLYSNHAFTFLPKLLSASGPDSYLYAAMRSVATVNFANRSRTVDMHGMVELEYARAVSRVTAALADPQEYLKDETLVAVWLLGVRELLAAVDATYTRAAYQTHVDGTLMLLRLRGDEQFSRPEGRHLYATFLSAMVRAPDSNTRFLSADLFQHWKPLFASEEPSQEYLKLEAQIPRAVEVPTASLKLRSFFHGVSKLRARVKNFLLCDDPSIDRSQAVGSYLKAAARLEAKIDGWCDIPSWLPRNIAANTSQRYVQRTPWAGGSLFTIHWFATWDAFFHWNRYRIAKICLHAALLDALSALSDQESREGAFNVDNLIISHTAAIQETIKEFLGTLAWALGDVDYEGRLRPLPTAITNDGASPDHRGIDITSTMQVQAPLAYLVTLQYLAPGQREAMFLALQRIRAEFRVR